MRLTLREYLDKWYELDENYDKEWEITVWYVETANDNRKCWFNIGGSYTPEDNAIYVFIEDKPTDDPEIPMFEIFKKEQIEKRVRLWNEACDEYFGKQQYTCWLGVFVAFFVLVLFWLSEK